MTRSEIEHSGHTRNTGGNRTRAEAGTFTGTEYCHAISTHHGYRGIVSIFGRAS